VDEDPAGGTTTHSDPRIGTRLCGFYEFASMVVGWTRRDGIAAGPALLIQPLAIADLAEVLVDTVEGTGSGEIREVAGPEPQDLSAAIRPMIVTGVLRWTTLLALRRYEGCGSTVLGQGGEPVERGLQLVHRGRPSTRDPLLILKLCPVVGVRHACV
jgi:hypothetical protein